LCEARAQDVGLPILAARGDLLLFDAIFHFPNFGAVIFGEAENDYFEERIVGAKIELVVKLGDERAERFEKGDADGLEVGLGLAGVRGLVLVGSFNVLKVTVQADRAGSGRRLPLGGAEDDADVGGIQLHEARRDRVSFDGLIDSGEDDDVIFSDLKDDAAAGEAGDDFVFALLGLHGGEDGLKGCS